MSKNISSKHFKILVDCKIEQLRILAWKIVNDQKIIIEGKVTYINRNPGLIKVTFFSRDEIKKIFDLAKNESHINFFIPKHALMFTAIKIKDPYIHDISCCSIELKLPEKLNQLNRRKHKRVSVYNLSTFKANISFIKKLISSDQKTHSFKFFDKELLDISVGGTSFLASKLEKKHFKKGDELTGFMFYFDGHEAKLSGKIVNIIQISPDIKNKLMYGGLKISIKFTEIDQHTKELISQFVENLAIQDFSKKSSLKTGS